MIDPSSSPVPPAEFGVLLALLDGDKHGHGIKVDIRSRTGGAVDMGPGTLYGAIKRLVNRGWIAEVEPTSSADAKDGRRRYYTLTADGRAAAAAETARMEGLVAIARAKTTAG